LLKDFFETEEEEFTLSVVAEEENCWAMDCILFISVEEGQKLHRSTRDGEDA